MTNVSVAPKLFASLIENFISSPQFQALAKNTKALWTHELRQAAHLDALGIYSLKEIRPALVQKYLDGLHGRPGKQAAALTAIRALNKWARVRDLLPSSIVDGVATGRPGGGHIPWTAAQVAAAERDCRADLARAIVLGANTAKN